MAGRDEISIDAQRAALAVALGDAGRDSIEVNVGARTEVEIDGGAGRDQERLNRQSNGRDSRSDRSSDQRRSTPRTGNQRQQAPPSQQEPVGESNLPRRAGAIDQRFDSSGRLAAAEFMAEDDALEAIVESPFAEVPVTVNVAAIDRLFARWRL